jgi:hypothetical protein
MASVGTPSRRKKTALRANSSLAVGTANLEKTRPVATAATRSETIDSAVTARCAGRETGYMAPYPMVPMVCTLKKNASANEPGRALATPPTSQKTIPKRRFTATTRPAMMSSVTPHGARRSTW